MASLLGVEIFIASCKGKMSFLLTDSPPEMTAETLHSSDDTADRLDEVGSN